MNQEIDLKVAEAMQIDYGKRVVRIDSTARRILNVTTGDVVEIRGKKNTAAIVLPAHPADEGLNLVRMDGILRQNASVGLGDKVKIKKAEIKPAKKIVLAPNQPTRYAPGFDQYVKKNLIGKPLQRGDVSNVNVFGTAFPFVVVQTVPLGVTIVVDDTIVELREEPMKELGRIPTISYEDVGGLKEEIRKVREMVELPMRHPELFERLGIEPPKGILLHGPPGTGKTLVAKAVANESEAHFITIAAPEIVSKFVGEAEERLRAIFAEAEERAPSIIFIDEIDAIAPKREEVMGEVEKRIVSQLLSSMDGLKSRGSVIVLAATNRPNSLDPALRRPGRFDREIEIGVPDKQGRREILQIHSRGMPLDVEPYLRKSGGDAEKARDLFLDDFAAVTYGFVGADLQMLCKEAAMKVLRRILPKIDLEKEIPQNILDGLKVTKEDFENALKEVQPSALREVYIEVPNVKWEQIGGLEEIKRELKEAVELPLKSPEVFTRVGIRPVRGILLFGYPGTGKTLLAKAVATQSEANFIAVRGPELLCVSGDTPVITDYCGLRTISSFYQRVIPESEIEHSAENLEVRRLLKPINSIGYSGQGIKPTKIIRVHKLLVNDAYELAFSNNARITVSCNQPFLVFRDNRLTWVKSSELAEGDFVATPSHLTSLEKDSEIRMELPVHAHLKVRSEDEEAYHVSISSKATTRLPKRISPELAEFMGWFAAEGNISKEAVAICNKGELNRKRIAELFGQFATPGKIKFFDDKILVYSTPLALYLEKAFEQPVRGKKSYSIQAPPLLFKCGKKVMAGFLKGAFLGDGHVDDRRIEYGTKSSSLSRGICYFLSLFGIKYRLWQRKDGMFMVTVSGKREIGAFKSAVFSGSDSHAIRQHYNARYVIPDVSDLLKQAKLALGLHYGRQIPEGLFEGVLSKRKKSGLIRLQRMMGRIGLLADDAFRNTSVFRTLQAIAQGELSWTRLVAKERAQPQVMYDLETENGTFVGGEIPLLLHNSKWIGDSEKGIREIFRKARSAAPTIIFFDEIDAIAPARGGEDNDSHVTERMVNTLLAEMDGIQNLKDIVVIGATNRADILDPALLRPGRFDKVLFIPAPDEKTRLEILKVHTRKMPIAKDVSIADIAKKAEGYSGADLEGLCREAGMNALRDNIGAKEVNRKNFEKALGAVRPTLAATLQKQSREQVAGYA